MNSITASSKQKRIGHSRDGLDSSRKRADAIEDKRKQISLSEALLQEWEEAGTGSHEYMKHLRAKVRQKRNELEAMGI